MFITLVNGYRGVGFYKDGKFVRVQDEGSAIYYRTLLDALGIPCEVYNTNFQKFWESIKHHWPSDLDSLKMDYAAFRSTELGEGIKYHLERAAEFQKDLDEHTQKTSNILHPCQNAPGCPVTSPEPHMDQNLVKSSPDGS